MTTWVHIYTDKHGKPCDEVGFAASEEAAMEWLDNYHDGFVRAGYEYQHTIMIPDGKVGQTSTCLRQHLLDDLEAWREDKAADVFDEIEHERIESAMVTRHVNGMGAL